MSALQKLTDILAHLPGLGPRQARRAVQYLLAREPRFRTELAEMIARMSDETMQCSRCFRFDEPHTSKLCAACGDTARDGALLMVVEHDVDIDAVEASGTYRGYYFVLGGLMNLVKQRKEKIIRIAELQERVGTVQEIIFALATTPEGDYTAREISKQLSEKHSHLTITLLGRGLSVGAELEYADAETLRSALKNRS